MIYHGEVHIAAQFEFQLDTLSNLTSSKKEYFPYEKRILKV